MSVLTLGKRRAPECQMTRCVPPPARNRQQIVAIRCPLPRDADRTPSRTRPAQNSSCSAACTSVNTSVEGRSIHARKAACILSPARRSDRCVSKSTTEPPSNSDSNLCHTCRLSTIVRGRSLDEEIVQCHALSMRAARVTFKVTLLLGLQRRTAAELPADGRARLDPAARLEAAARRLRAQRRPDSGRAVGHHGGSTSSVTSRGSGLESGLVGLGLGRGCSDRSVSRRSESNSEN